MKKKNEYLARCAVGGSICAVITYAFGFSEGAIIFGVLTLAIQQGYLVIRDLANE